MRVSAPAWLASPKSTSITRPPGVSMMFEGLMSRCMDEVGAIDQVLIEDVGDVSGQFPATAVVGVGEIGAQWRVRRRIVNPLQQVKQMPTGHRRIEPLGSGERTENAAEHVPHEAGRERELHVGTEPAFGGEPERHPALHADALHHDDVGREGCGERGAEDVGEARREVL